jgi:phosphoadenosine phosphosulfate reductase
MSEPIENYSLFSGLEDCELLKVAIESAFPGRIALVSSFGAESAVLLHMVASIDPTTPVIFLDTGKLFGETRRYARDLEERFGLTDLRIIRPEKVEEQKHDPDGMLFSRDHDQCCAFRKVLPLKKALEGFDAWITGRKQFQGGERNELPLVEPFAGQTKFNPLAHWAPEQIEAYFEAHDLPHHPLESDGYLSIGCMPCTDRADPGGDQRDGRWKGTGKTECGIHLIQSNDTHGTNNNEQSRFS